MPSERGDEVLPLSGIVRRVRRVADVSQRELAARVGVSRSAIAKIENGSCIPSLPVMQRVLGVANFRLVVVDADNRRVPALEVWDDVTDLAGRRFPPHLDTIIDPQPGEWWADGFGLARPPETFRRNRAIRDYERRRSRWEVRVSLLRNQPPPAGAPRAAWRPEPRDDVDADADIDVDL